MERSPELAPLSRDHHQGLFVALKLKRATPDAREAFLAFWVEGRQHFAVEEDLLLPALARHVPPDHEEVVRVLTEHVDLRRRAQDLAADTEPAPETLRELGERLAAHIRHEENVVFTLVEETLPRDELAALGAALADL